MINEEQNYFKLKENRRAVSEIERVLLIEQKKGIRMAEVPDQNERESLKLEI